MSPQNTKIPQESGTLKMHNFSESYHASHREYYCTLQRYSRANKITQTCNAF